MIVGKQLNSKVKDYNIIMALQSVGIPVGRIITYIYIYTGLGSITFEGVLTLTGGPKLAFGNGT